MPLHGAPGPLVMRALEVPLLYQEKAVLGGGLPRPGQIRLQQLFTHVSISFWKGRNCWGATPFVALVSFLGRVVAGRSGHDDTLRQSLEIIPFQSSS